MLKALPTFNNRATDFIVESKSMKLVGPAISLDKRIYKDLPNPLRKLLFFDTRLLHNNGNIYA